MKTALLIVLLIPFLSFGQDVVQTTYKLTKKDKKSIDQHTLSMCNCFTEQVNAIHPKTAEVLLLIKEKGEEGAAQEVELMIEQMEPEELQSFMESFAMLDSPEFEEKIDICDHISKLSSDIQDQINDEEGPAHDYFMSVLGREEDCAFMQYIFELGSKK